MDPIADLFETMRVTAAVHCRLEATAPWGLTREASAEESRAGGPEREKASPCQLAHFGTIARGNCWLTVAGIADPLSLTGGDCFLLAPGTSYTLRDDPRTPAHSFCEVAPEGGSGVVRYGGGGTATTVISGFLSFDTASIRTLTHLLPSLILIKADQAQSLALHATLQMLAVEMAEQTPGAKVVADCLASILFVQAIRAHMASGSESCQRGWLRAIFDPKIGAALKAIHDGVSSPWTVESLATAAGMSRSAFASRFKELLEQTPLEYVTDWRMQKATRLLREQDKKLVEIAESVGYESGAAFSKAFKRIVGVAPGEYRQSGNASV